MDIYEKIKKRREELGMSQEELAEEMGYKSKTSIHKIEQKMTDLPLSRVVEFAKVLKVSSDYLMGYVNEDNSANTEKEYFVDTSILTADELVEFNKVTGVNQQLFFNDVNDDYDMAMFKQAIINLLISQRNDKKKKKG